MTYSIDYFNRLPKFHFHKSISRQLTRHTEVHVCVPFLPRKLQSLMTDGVGVIASIFFKHFGFLHKYAKLLVISPEQVKSAIKRGPSHIMAQSSNPQRLPGSPGENEKNSLGSSIPRKEVQLGPFK